MLKSEQAIRNKMAFKIYLAHISGKDGVDWSTQLIKACYLAADEIIKQGKIK